MDRSYSFRELRVSVLYVTNNKTEARKRKNGRINVQGKEIKTEFRRCRELMKRQDAEQPNRREAIYAEHGKEEKKKSATAWELVCDPPDDKNHSYVAIIKIIE